MPTRSPHGWGTESQVRVAGRHGGGSLAAVPRSSDKPMMTKGHIRPLTPRQAEVLALHDGGMTRAAIARHYGVRNIDNVLDMALLKAGRE